MLSTVITLMLFLEIELYHCVEQESVFIEDSLCGVSERIKQGCSKGVTGARGLLECTFLCNLQQSCIGASLDAAGKCFLHQMCTSMAKCDGSDNDHNYWSSYCVQGSWNRHTNSCNCVPGTFGDRCRYPQYCRDLPSAEYEDGYHRTYLDLDQDERNIIQVVCYIVNHGRYANVQIISNMGGVNFNRTWNEYVYGFYADNRNHWVGLRALNILTEAGCHYLTLVAELKKPTAIGTVTNAYSGFKVFMENENYQYRLNSHSTQGLCGDCLNNTQQTPFSTWDNENDENDDVNCAALAGSGWWFKDCENPCNLLGWGFDDWDKIPSPQRFSLDGYHLGQLHVFFAYLKCY